MEEHIEPQLEGAASDVTMPDSRALPPRNPLVLSNVVHKVHSVLFRPLTLSIFLILDIALLALSGGFIFYNVYVIPPLRAKAMTQAQQTDFARVQQTVFAHASAIAATQTTGTSLTAATATAVYNMKATATEQSSQPDYLFLAQGAIDNQGAAVDRTAISQGENFTIYFALQNMGNTTWSDAGGYQLKCIAARNNPNCPSTTVYINMQGGIVPPNQGYVFFIPVTAPGPGNYRSAWEFVYNNDAEFHPNGTGNLTLYITFTVV